MACTAWWQASIAWNTGCHAHPDRHHTQIHDHLHGQTRHIAPIVEAPAKELPCLFFRCW